jgi:two-component system sensor histidine kinase KdpD
MLNTPLSEILGIDRTELLGKRLDALLNLDLDGHVSTSSDEINTSEQWYLRPDGEMVWLRIGVSSVSIRHGRETYYVVAVEDISADHVSERTLGIAAHELRLPLSHIKGFISTLRRTDVQWTASTRRELLAEAEHEANRLERLIRDLLDQSSDGRGKSHPRRTLVHPCALVLTTVARVRPMIADREVRVAVPKELPLVRVDVPDMERVLANLLLNANKYTPHETPIDVSARPVGKMLELRVEDRGPGIPETELERIFQPFYRREVHAQDGGDGGHGLGLAICRSIVMAHGGRIWAEQRLGGGSTFTLALPVSGRTRRQPGRRGASVGCGAEAGHRWPRTPGPRLVHTAT